MSKLNQPELTALYASEAYTIKTYRFAVSNGLYRVRIYLKHGYHPTAKAGTSALNIAIEGRSVMDGLDLFSAGGLDFNQSLVYEYPLNKVADGVLDIEFSCAPEVDPSTRLCNAIEIIPEINEAL